MTDALWLRSGLLKFGLLIPSKTSLPSNLGNAVSPNDYVVLTCCVIVTD